MRGISANARTGYGLGTAQVANGTIAGRGRAGRGMSLLFAAGERPDATAVEDALESAAANGVKSSISYRPDVSEGWLELLSSGLTFDLVALQPADALVPDRPVQRIGMGEESGSGWEAVSLMPGEHIASGATMMPVVRTMAGLGAGLAVSLSARAVCWEPAGSWVEPHFFAKTVNAWLGGGAFPALGLTSLTHKADGTLRTTGLFHLIGQELVLETEGSDGATAAKLAMRLIDHLVSEGALRGQRSMTLPDGVTLIASAEEAPGTLWVRIAS